MARVVIQRTFPDGDNLLIEITVANSFPDSVAEARQAALRAYEDALEITVAPADDEAGE